MVLLPLLLTAMICLWYTWRTRVRAAMGEPVPPERVPFRPRVILALSFLAVLSHPLLDLLNTYGVRLLSPFDGRWFYGDTLFIVDPWFWLLTATGVMFARSHGWRAIAGWILLAGGATALIVTTTMVQPIVKIAWCAAILVLAFLRWRHALWVSGERLARAGIAVLLVYIGTAHGLARLAESANAGSYPEAREIAVSPVPAIPVQHRVVVVEENLYRIVTPDGTVHEIPRKPPDAIVEAALASETIRGYANWLRFPLYTVEDAPDHWLVRIQDLRYQGPDMASPRGFGTAEVAVPKTDALLAAVEPAAARKAAATRATARKQSATTQKKASTAR
jgi:inner membrane protein